MTSHEIPQPVTTETPQFNDDQLQMLAELYPAVRGSILSRGEIELPREVRQFPGIFFDQESQPDLPRFIEIVSHDCNLSAEVVRGMLDQLGMRMGLSGEQLGQDAEIHLYLGGLYGYDPKLFEKVLRMQPTAIVVSKITGSLDGFRNHQKPFFEVANSAAPYVDSSQTLRTLPVVGSHDKSVLDAYKEYMIIRLTMEGKSKEEVDRVIESLSEPRFTRDVEENIRDMATGKNHGVFVGKTWEEGGKREITKRVKEETEKTIQEFFLEAVRRGIQLIVVPSNMDNKITWSVVAGRDSFDPWELFDKYKIPYIKGIEGISSPKGAVFFIGGEFFTLLDDFDKATIRDVLKPLEKHVREARLSGASIALMGAADPYPLVHILQLAPERFATGSNTAGGVHTRQLVDRFVPNIVFSNHNPEPRRDEKGIPIDDNRHWQMVVQKEPAPLALENPPETEFATFVHIPAGKIAGVVYRRGKAGVIPPMVF